MLRTCQNREVVGKLFDTIAPRFAERPGGYTRLLRLGFRRGDSAEMAQVELVGSEFDPNAEAEKADDGRQAEEPRAWATGSARPPRGSRQEGEGEGGEGRQAGEGAAQKKRKPSDAGRGKGGKADTRGRASKTSSAAQG